MCRVTSESLLGRLDSASGHHEVCIHQCWCHFSAADDSASPGNAFSQVGIPESQHGSLQVAHPVLAKCIYLGTKYQGSIMSLALHQVTGK